MKINDLEAYGGYIPSTSGTANTSYCSDSVLNGSHASYLKNISQSSPIAVSPQSLVNTDNITNFYNSEQQTNTTNYGYHTFTNNDFQKPFDKIQTLYPNTTATTYQFYTHYQNDNNY